MDLPAIDAHAHIDTSVTARQLGQLGSAIVFAMTREPAEAGEALRRSDRNVLWAAGAHPAYVAKGGEVDLAQFTRRLDRFAIVGEVGLDRRSGNLDRQTEVFRSILTAVGEAPVLVSIHSAGCTSEVVRELSAHPVRGPIAHWFSGTPAEVERLLDIGCYFSVNVAMRPQMLKELPIDRVLPETDFPAARRRTGSRPGDVASLEALLAELHGLDVSAVRRQMLKNLRRLSLHTGAIDRMPAPIADTLLLA